MKSIFIRNKLFKLRFILVALLAIFVIVNSKFNLFNSVKIYINTAISPFYFLANAPRKILDNINSILLNNNQIKLENYILKQELLFKNVELLKLEKYREENVRLRELLNSPLLQDEQKMLTEVIYTTQNLYSDQIIIDKGSANGVYEGQVVINDKGIVGQVISVSKITSRVLLICNVNHALPIQILRNDIRFIVVGNGCSCDLKTKYLPSNIDIQIGDVLVTSGLGGRFPEGYPVAIVSSVTLDTKNAYTIVKARPIANLKNLHYLLLLFKKKSSNLTTPEEVNLLANRRLTRLISRISSTYVNIN